MTKDLKTVTLVVAFNKDRIMDVLNIVVHTDMDSMQAVNQ